MASVIIFVILHGNNPVPWWWELPNQLQNPQIEILVKETGIFWLLSIAT